MISLLRVTQSTNSASLLQCSDTFALKACANDVLLYTLLQRVLSHGAVRFCKQQTN